MDETQMGPLCTKGQLENIKTELAFAVEEGATLLCGGKSPEGLGELFFEPTIVDCPSQKLKIVDTELFGPVLSVIKFKTEEEVISLANDTKHGLAAGIFSKSNSRCLRVSKAVHAGIVWVNTYRVVSPIAEFGGFKNSGYGRESQPACPRIPGAAGAPRAQRARRRRRMTGPLWPIHHRRGHPCCPAGSWRSSAGPPTG